MTTRNNRPISRLLAAAVLITGLSGCGSGAPKAGRPDATPSDGGSPSTSAPSGTPSTQGPPVRPKAANGLTLAAAEAFYRHYVDLKNYAAETGDTAGLLAASESGCEGCREYADYVAKVNAANGGLTGDFRERVKDLSELARGTSGRVGGTAVIAVGTYTTKNSATAKPIVSKAAEFTAQIALSARSGNWIMYEMQFEER